MTKRVKPSFRFDQCRWSRCKDHAARANCQPNNARFHCPHPPRLRCLVTAACREETPRVRPSARFKEVLGWFEKYHLHALAVVDEFDELLGVINVEDVMTRLARKR